MYTGSTRSRDNMNYVIKDKGEVFVDFMEDYTPAWSFDGDNAQQFESREEAIKVRDKLRKLGLDPKMVKIL
jgi:hypothetical protein